MQKRTSEIGQFSSMGLIVDDIWMIRIWLKKNSTGNFEKVSELLRVVRWIAEVNSTSDKNS